MPNYQYNCPICDIKHIIYHSIKDPNIHYCKNCNQLLTLDITGGSTVIFNGSGFHQNDYKK